MGSKSGNEFRRRNDMAEGKDLRHEAVECAGFVMNGGSHRGNGQHSNSLAALAKSDRDESAINAGGRGR